MSWYMQHLSGDPERRYESMKKTFILTILVVLISFLLYSFKLDVSLFYHPDFARDLFEIFKITQGDLALIGPKLTFGGLYTGPYYFYLFAPIFFLSKANIMAILYFNAFLFAVAIGYFFKKAYEKFSFVQAGLGACVLTLLPLSVIGGRSPSNAYTFIPLLLILLTYVYFHSPQKPLPLLLAGFLFGVIINFHFVNIILMPLFLMLLLPFLKKKKQILYFIGGIAFSFLPLLVFELKHNFIMFTNTFIQKSYLNWMENKNIPNGVVGKKNVIENILFMSGQLRHHIILNPLIPYGLLLVLFKLERPQKKERMLFAGSLLALLIFSMIIRFQFIPHYLVAVGLTLSFSFVVIFLRSRLWPSLIILLFLGILFFPTHMYRPSERRPERFEKAVQFAVQKNLVRKDVPFNVIQITRQNLLATLGFEYRFFFKKYGYSPDSEFAYSTSKDLIVFSELPDYDISRFRSWEAEQFGTQYFQKAKKYRSGETVIYKISK